MAQGPQAFYCLWQNKEIRERLFELLPKADICRVRLASSACCNLVTNRLFLRTHLTFAAHTFTRQDRIEALSRIGHHVEHLTFYFPHSDATFLPPLVHPDTGREISFLYKPHTSMASVLERPKFATSGLGEILTLQYPPLFHAASNVPSFINAMRHLHKLRHLTIRTPGQDPKERYRRDIVDYALVSLRIAVERSPLNRLSKLTLSPVHPSAFIYLRHTPGGFGCLPSAGRRWGQIRKMHVSVESWDFYGPAPGLDHLQMIDDFVRGFEGSLEKFTFSWQGRYKGPCPLSLASDPLFAPPRGERKLFHEVTSPMSPLPPARPPKRPIVLRRARHLAVRNATMNEAQVADLVRTHRRYVREFDFENVVLISGGSWDEALAPLMETPSSRSDREYWTRHSSATISDAGSPPFTLPEVLAEDLPAPSAAVAAVSQELLHLDADLFRDEDEDEEGGAKVNIELPSDVEAARKASLSFPNKLKKRRVTKKRRMRKESHPRRPEDEAEEDRVASPVYQHRERRALRRENSDASQSSRSAKEHFHRRFWQKISKDNAAEEPRQATPPAAAGWSPPASSPARLSPAHSRNHSRQASKESLFHGSRPLEPPQITIPHQATPPMSSSSPSSSSRMRLFGEIDSIRSGTSSPSSSLSPSSSRRLFGEITPDSVCGSEPDLSHSPIDEEEEDDDYYYRPQTPSTPTPQPIRGIAGKPSLLPSPMSRPPMPMSPSSSYTHPYSPGPMTAVPGTPSKMREMMQISPPILDTAPPMPALLQPNVYDPTAELCSEISAVQRDMEAEEAQRAVAEMDPDDQTSALRRARDLVLSRLGGRGLQSSASSSSNSSSGYDNLTRKDSNQKDKEGSGMTFLSSARFREGLFGRSNSAAATSTAQLSDHRSMDVPILFSRC